MYLLNSVASVMDVFGESFFSVQIQYAVRGEADVLERLSKTSLTTWIYSEFLLEFMKV